MLAPSQKIPKKPNASGCAAVENGLTLSVRKEHVIVGGSSGDVDVEGMQSPEQSTDSNPPLPNTGHGEPLSAITFRNWESDLQDSSLGCKCVLSDTPQRLSITLSIQSRPKR